MLEVIKDTKGDLKAAIEFYVVNSDGTMNDKGLYCWINDCYVSKTYQNNGCLRNFVKTIILKYPQLQFAYFSRDKYKDKNGKWRLRIYTKRQWLKLIIGGKSDAK